MKKIYVIYIFMFLVLNFMCFLFFKNQSDLEMKSFKEENLTGILLEISNDSVVRAVGGSALVVPNLDYMIIESNNTKYKIYGKDIKNKFKKEINKEISIKFRVYKNRKGYSKNILE